MDLDGLNAILTKDEVVATQTEQALRERPREVDDAYKAAVRTYVPLHTGRGESHVSVEEYAKRLTRQVKEKQAARGYLTADFGYGKTSTALYLWSQAQQSNLLVVPPFQLTRLPSLIVATYGWVDYVLAQSRPSLCAEAKSIYDGFAERSLEKMAGESRADLGTLRQWLHDGRLTLDLTAPDYIAFFEGMTEIAHRAGFDGLLVFADEIQQYLEPEIKAGAKDPVAPLFNVIQGLATRKNHLAFGLILVIPRKELSVIVDQRGDFVDRMRTLALDLGAIYDQTFPARLWDRLARTFEFSGHTSSMVQPEALEALGEISVRDDLSNGPRTVVNAFHCIARRYLEQPGARIYTPIDLVDDFLNGNIRFDGVSRLQEVTTRALGHSLVRGHLEREQAIKLAAAFPERGATRDVQGRLQPAFDDLLQSAQGDLVIRVGDVRNPGITLLGLERSELPVDWLTLTVREFSRTYYENAEKTTDRAIEGFLDLLTSQVFRSGQWKVLERRTSRLTQNAGLVLEGAFSSMARRFPARRVHVRVLMEDEPVKDANPAGDVVVEFRLRRYLDHDEQRRRTHVEPVQLDAESSTARFVLNTMSRSGPGVSRELDEAVGKIVSPFKLTPLLLLTLHQVINEKRNANQIPKTDDQLVQYQFQPALLDNATVELFRPEVGASYDAAGPRLIEIVIGQLLESRYGDTYHPLMTISNWQSSIKKYENAIHRLSSLPEKQGQMNVEGLKDTIAGFFAVSNTAFDSFVDNFPDLIEVVRAFPSQRDAAAGATGAVRFRLHQLESQISDWLRKSARTLTIQSGNETHQLRYLPIGQVYSWASELGYRDEEIDAIIELMEARSLVERDRRGSLVEALRVVPSVDEIDRAVKALKDDVDHLLRAFPTAQELLRIKDQADLYTAKVEELRTSLDEVTLVSLRRTVATRQSDIAAIAQSRQADFKEKCDSLMRRLPTLDSRRRAILETQIEGVKYADQVNNLRVRLLRAYLQFGNQVDDLRSVLGSLQRTLSTGNLSSSEFADRAVELRDLERDAGALRKSEENLTEQYRLYSEWGRLVEDGSRLFDEILQLGDSATDLGAKLEKLSQDIRGDISAHSLEALQNVTTYGSRLNELRGQARSIREQAVTAFNDLQNRYRDELVRRIGYPRDRLWPPVIFSTLDPAGVYQQLYGRVNALLEDTVDRVRQLQTTNLASARNLLSTPRLQDLPPQERLRIEEQGKSLEVHLVQLGDNLGVLRRRLGSTETVRDFPVDSGGRFQELLDGLKDAHDGLDRFRKQLEALTLDLRRIALDGNEAQFQKALLKLSSESYVDLTDVTREMRGQDAGTQWQALRGLWEKQRVQVQVRMVRYEEDT